MKRAAISQAAPSLCAPLQGRATRACHFRLQRASAAIVLAAFVAACGGGGGGGDGGAKTSTSTTLSGTVAVGDPITGATVNVKCASGPAIAAVASDAQGAWNVDIAKQTLPCVAESSGGFVGGVANATAYHTIALDIGVANITPMTDLLVAHWVQNANLAGWFTGLAPATIAALDRTQRAAALVRLRGAVPLLTGLQTMDPITTAFSPVAGNSMDDMLEAIKNARTATGFTHTDDLTNVTQGTSITVNSTFYSSLIWKYRATSSGAAASGVAYAASSIVNTAPTETYTAASEEEKAFNLLNAERARCGFGYLAQNTMIDAAARAHADWQLINWTNSHYETSGTTGFTGVNGGDRISYQGYNWGGYADDIAMVLGSSNKSNYGIGGVRQLLSAPFHARALISYYRDVGFGIRSNTDSGAVNAGVVSQVDLAYTSNTGKQHPASDEILTYPCQGVTGVNYRLNDETPNPVPGRDLATSPLGHPIMISVRQGNSLNITSATMTNLGTSQSVTLRSAATTKADDTQQRFGNNEAYVIPDTPLSPNTTYRVVLSGTNASVPFTKTFTFSTGNGG